MNHELVLKEVKESFENKVPDLPEKPADNVLLQHIKNIDEEVKLRTNQSNIADKHANIMAQIVIATFQRDNLENKIVEISEDNSQRGIKATTFSTTRVEFDNSMDKTTITRNKYNDYVAKVEHLKLELIKRNRRMAW